MADDEHELDTGGEDKSDDLPLAERVGQWLAIPLIIALFAGAVLIMIGIVPNKAPVKTDPGFLDSIFASRTIIAAARIVLLFSAGYAIYSIVKLILAGKPITDFGPFKTSVADSVAEVSAQRDALAADLAQAESFIALLQAELAQREGDLEETSRTVDSLLEVVDSLSSSEEQPE